MPCKGRGNLQPRAVLLKAQSRASNGSMMMQIHKLGRCLENHMAIE